MSRQSAGYLDRATGSLAESRRDFLTTISPPDRNVRIRRDECVKPPQMFIEHACE